MKMFIEFVSMFVVIVSMSIELATTDIEAVKAQIQNSSPLWGLFYSGYYCSTNRSPLRGLRINSDVMFHSTKRPQVCC
jgi:hypothetical protein